MILISEFKSPKQLQEEWIARKRKRPAKYIGLGIGGNGFLNSKTGFRLKDELEFLELDYAKSVSVQLNFFAYRFGLSNDFGLLTGLGFNFDHFVFNQKDQDFVLNGKNPSAQNLQSLEATRGLKFKKYTLNTVDIHLPLLFDFSPIKYRFRLALGTTFAYLIDKKMLRKYEDPDFGLTKQIRKEKLDFNSFQISATGEIGYRFLHFYMDYGLLSWFSQSPYNQIHPFRMGIRLSF